MLRQNTNFASKRMILKKGKVIIETRTVKHREVKKINRNTWITLGILGVLTIASFSYLLVWLFAQEAQKALEVPTLAAQATVGTNANGTVDKQDGNTALNGKAPDVSIASSNGPSVKLTFVGDVMFADNVEDILKKNGWEYPFQYVKAYLDKADITVANLETPISTRGTAQSKEYVYRSSPEALPALKDAGIDLVNTANNHILDFGTDALLDTMDELDKVDIKRIGTGHNIEEAYKPVIMERNGMKIAFLGFSRVVPDAAWYAGKQRPGVAETYSPKLPLEAITKARQEADLVVVMAHWGVERKDSPVSEQVDLAHQYIDSGADLVVASHPHVLQGFEQYNGKWIAYSLGNFIFTTNNEPATWETMILDVVCTKERTCDLQMLPVLTKGAQPVRMPELEGAKLFDRMSNISLNARIDKDGKVLLAPARMFVPEPAPVVKKPAAVPSPTKPADKKPASDLPASGLNVQPDPKKPTQQQPAVKPTETHKPVQKPSETQKPVQKPTQPKGTTPDVKKPPSVSEKPSTDKNASPDNKPTGDNKSAEDIKKQP
jgi:poly-gamma-glutamate capsule biosynthesis protein CapA/YwtB (metallophosphatase superfamily)